MPYKDRERNREYDRQRDATRKDYFKDINAARQDYFKTHNAARAADRKLADALREECRSGKHFSKFDKGHIIAWDGEGANIKGLHQYILFKSSAGHVLKNSKGLHSYHILKFLMESAASLPKDTIHVMFSHGYDVNMSLRHLPHWFINNLWNGGKVQDKKGKRKSRRYKSASITIDGIGYSIEYRQRKKWTIRTFDPNDRGCYDEKGDWHGKYLQSITLWDVWGFFQTSFVKALKEWIPDIEDDPNYHIIKKHKAERHLFRPEELPDIERYCDLELEYLIKLMKQLHSDLIEADIAVKEWHGGGAVASALLQKENVTRYKSHFDSEHERKHVIDRARLAYAGARIEQYALGHTHRTMYHYDKVSAYPSAMPNLPCLACGHWEKVSTYEPGSYGMYEVEWDYSPYNSAGPFPFFYRTKNGGLLYPRRGRGVYWTPEIDVAIKCMPRNDCSLKIRGGLVYRRGCDHQPFAFIPKVFNQRIEWKHTCYQCGTKMDDNDWCSKCNKISRGKGGQRILKLGMNSIYGKLAQRVGASQDKNGKWNPPPFHELCWAGWITAETRASMYETAMIAPYKVIMIQTDGITFLDDISDKLDIGSGLGQWERKKPWLETYCIQPGIYFARTGEEWTIHYRGFDEGQLTPENVSRAWRNKVINMTVKATRFIGFGSCVMTNNWDDWCQWPTKDRECLIYPLLWSPTKKLSAVSKSVACANDYYDPFLPNPDDDLLQLYCCDAPNWQQLSFPHQLDWEPDEVDYSNYGKLEDEDGVPLWLADMELEESRE